MKKIKIKICDYDPSNKNSYGYYILKKLEKNYIVELTENPDYIFFNDSNYEHLNFNCIKIWFTGENIHPDFNICDYAFGFDYLNFEDRYARLPVYFIAIFYRKKEMLDLKDLNIFSNHKFTHDDLKNKTEFCSFVYSNYLAENSRREMFELISKYKKVNSGGKYLNNIDGPTDNKLAFESKHKFSIAFENSSNNGYTTEKILNAFAAKTIPIYWGNPMIDREFNTKRFINCHEYKDFNEVLEIIKKIDNNDELYLQIINEPILNNNFLSTTESNFELFLRNIFDQPLEKAKRIKINPAKKNEILKNETLIYKNMIRKNIIRKILSKIYNPFKSIRFLDEIKQRYFINKIYNK